MCTGDDLKKQDNLLNVHPDSVTAATALRYQKNDAIIIDISANVINSDWSICVEHLKGFSWESYERLKFMSSFDVHLINE